MGMAAAPSHTAPEALLTVSGLRKSFGGYDAVGGVNLQVHRNTVHALIGPNGAGKTTFFHLLTKYHQPTSGTIHFQGKDITRATQQKVAQMGMVRSFQISAIFPEMTLRENVRFALQRRLHGASYDFWRREEVLNRYNEQAYALLEEVGIAHLSETLAGDLPYGSKRALELATTIALDPTLLLLDEPMAGLGLEDISRISALIARLARERTILMVEHNLSVVAALSDRITVLARGQILADGTYAEVAANPAVVHSYIGANDD